MFGCALVDVDHLEVGSGELAGEVGACKSYICQSCNRGQQRSKCKYFKKWCRDHMDPVTARQGEPMRRDAVLDFNLRWNVLLGLLAELGTGT